MAARRLSSRYRLRVLALAVAGPALPVVAATLLALRTPPRGVAVAAVAAVAAAWTWCLALARARRFARVAAADEAVAQRVRELNHERFVAAHEAGNAILRGYEEDGVPYVLCLRSFEPEAYTWLTPEGTGSYGASRNAISFVSGHTDQVEVLIAAALGRRRPALAVANPAALQPAGREGIRARVQLPDERWQELVRSFIEHANLIVMHLTSLAAGVTAELDLIAGAAAADRTVLIIPDHDRPLASSAIRSVAEVIGAVLPAAEPPSRDHPRLRAFQHVITDRQLAESVLAAAADLIRAFDDRLARALVLRGIRLLDIRRDAEARADIESVLELAPDSQAATDARWAMAALQLRQGNASGLVRLVKSPSASSSSRHGGPTPRSEGRRGSAPSVSFVR